MAIPELLVADVFKTGAQAQVYELVGGTTLNAIGAAVGNNANEGTPATTEGGICNRVCEYRGELYMAVSLVTTGLEIHKYNRGTGLWSIIHSYGTGANSITGLYVVNTGTVQRMFLAARVVGSSRIIYTDDGTVWSETVDQINVGASSFGQNPGVMFNNKLYQGYMTNGHLCFEVDPTALSIVSLNVASIATTSDGGPMDLVAHDDRLMMLCTDDDFVGAVDWALYEFTGSGFVLNTQITTGLAWNNTTQVAHGMVCLFQDPGNNNLIALVNGIGELGAVSTDYGSSAFRLAPSGSSFTVTNITDPLIPTAYRPGTRTTVNDASDRWYCVVVNDTTPGTPEAYIFLAIGPAPGTGYSVYTYVDDTTELVSPVAGPSTAYSIPQTKFGGGLRINKASGNQCAIEFGQAVEGGYEVSYRIYGTVTSQTVRGYYSLDQETPTTQMTIASQTGGGAISGGNSITGVTGDDGSTLFTLVWDIETDLVVSGDAVHIILDIR
tara:strand:+ start:40893 stop:42377 length:1485 start_codon:yes stop_codon:yes gene_type:complete